MLEGIGIFVLFLVPLVFFHELGHFFFARLFGVRVETFSIGFGPKIFKYTHKGTVYTISAIPLGGYVKMFGDDPLSEEQLSPEEEKVAYTRKSKWARFWIVFGGPLANFIMAFVIYAGLIYWGENVPETRFGKVKESSVFYTAGVRSGDVLKNINDLEVISFDDLNLVDTRVESISIEREGNKIKLPLKMGGVEFVKKFSLNGSQLQAPIVIDSSGQSYILNGVDKSLEETLENEQNTVELFSFSTDLRKIKKLEEIKLKDSEPIIISNKNDLRKTLRNKGYYTRDLYIESVIKDSAAEEAELKAGDILLSLNGEELENFFSLREKLQSIGKEQEVTLQVASESGIRTVKLTPRFKEYNGEQLLTIGIYSGIVPFPVKMIEVKGGGILTSLLKALDRTFTNMGKVLLGFKRLITGEVSIKNIGGPIAIGKVATDSFNISLSMFFRLMALISLNLGIINLFPIPVLDGGHIVFIFCELVNGGPLSRKKLIVAQQLGMSLLFLLIFVALFNDISRFF